MTRSDRFFLRLATLQTRHPWRFLAVLALSTLPAIWATTRLELRTDWAELLPENQPSVIDLKRLQERFGGTGTLIVFVEGGPQAAMKRFADALAPRLVALPDDLVRYVDKDVSAERDFFATNKFLYPERSELEDIRDRLTETIAKKKAAAVFDLGLDDETDEPEAAATAPIEDDALDLSGIQQRYDDRVGNLDRFTDGYYIGENGAFLALFVRTAYSGSKISYTDRLEALVQQEIDHLAPTSYAPEMRVSLSGNVLRAREEHRAIRKELFVITTLVISLILGSIYFFYFNFRSLVVLALALLVGVLWTFGLTWAHIGYLSTATAFLASIVPGNGINTGLMLLARFFEERRRGRSTNDAISEAMRGSWAATLTAATAASLAYGALMLTDFRGFSQFGFIGGFGLMLCWVGAYLAIPPLLVVTQRMRDEDEIKELRRGAYGRPFLWLSRRGPRVAVSIGLVLAGIGIGFGYHWIAGDPFEYDFRRLRSDRTDGSGIGALQSRVNTMMASRDREGLVVLADRPDQIPLILDALDRARAAGGEYPPIGAVKSITSLIPEAQDEKRVILQQIRAKALEILPRLSEAERRELAPWIPPETIPPIREQDLPRTLLRPLTEKNGRVGLVLQVSHADGVSVWDGKQLLRFAAALRAIELPNGEVIRSSGASVIFADMVEAIVRDGPWLTLASLGTIFLLVTITFRRAVPVALTLGALLIGMAWMVGVAAAYGMNINFLNFIAIPITFGIGVDYAVNLVRRYVQEGWGATEQVLLETGGAVTLCSLTTTWGYLSLLYSDNQALRSFGTLAVLGEVTCLAAALIFIPSMIAISRRLGGGLKP